MSESDASVVVRSIADPRCFALIFDRYGDVVRRFAARRVPATDVDDIVAETFGIAFEQRASFGDRYPSARHWLLGVANNVIRHHQRSWTRRASAMRRAEMHTAAHLDPLVDVAGRLDATNEAAVLFDVLEQLSVEYRDVLLLVAWERLTPAEAALVLDIPAATARTRLHRARQQIMHELERSSSADEREVITDGKE